MQAVVQPPALSIGSQPYSSLRPQALHWTPTDEFLRGEEQDTILKASSVNLDGMFHKKCTVGAHRVLCLCFFVCLFSFFLWHSAFPLSYRNSSSRERGDNFDRSNRSSDRFDRRDDRDRNRLQVTKRSFSRENEERSREREQRGSADPVRRVASMTDDRDRGSRDRARSRENGGWHDIQWWYRFRLHIEL